MGNTAAILYVRDAYDTRNARLVGRKSAGEGFLKGLVQHGTADSLYCYTNTQEEFADFCQLIQPWLKNARPVQWLPAGNPMNLTRSGAIYRADPVITPLAWLRRFGDQRSYSICGVTHTIATKGPMEVIGDMLTAPIQPWDALVCTSKAVKTALDKVLGDYSEYLGQRLGCQPQIDIKLPIIPLGVDCNAFFSDTTAKATRDRLRQQFHINPQDIVILYVGRLNFYAKAHPLPMYLAVEQAAQLTAAARQNQNISLHFIQAGWFEDSKDENLFKEAAANFSPSVNTIFVDGRLPEFRTAIWSVADIFLSLSDNTQETFGLTPIEAMAAGLPAVVSDWDGYQESVRHGIDGFRIPTLIPPPSSCLDFAGNYWDDKLNYITYSAYTSMVTAVDVEACARSLASLITNPQLRQFMGVQGRQRAREVYDWKVVIAAYENLWQELSEIRARAKMSVPVNPGSPSIPFCDDPFRMFAHYSTQILSNDMIIVLGKMGNAASINLLRQHWLYNFGGIGRTPVTIIDDILATLAQEGSLFVGEIINRYGQGDPVASLILQRTLVYLLKFNVLQIQRLDQVL